MVLYRNKESRSREHCFRGKTVGVTYSEFVSVALVIQLDMRMRLIVNCGLPGFPVFLHIFS